MNPTLEELKTYFQTKREEELFQELELLQHEKIVADIRIEDLEAQNKILIETGHWIGQDEAHDLKVAVEEFLGYDRLGAIGGNEQIHFVPNWQMQKLRDALNDCGQFKDYSLDSPPQLFLDEAEKLIEKIKTDFFNTAPKHKEPPHNHPAHSPPQESERSQRHEG